MPDFDKSADLINELNKTLASDKYKKIAAMKSKLEDLIKQPLPPVKTATRKGKNKAGRDVEVVVESIPGFSGMANSVFEILHGADTKEKYDEMLAVLAEGILAEFERQESQGQQGGKTQGGAQK